MLKLSLYGFEVYQVRNQFIIFYLNYQLPFANQIFTLTQAIGFTCIWIAEQGNDYYGPTSKQFAEKASQFHHLIKE